MENIKDLRIVELLSSHLCHELVSPVGAISNGLEMIEEFGGEPDAAILGLIADSARITAKRLQYYRIAYGASSGPALTSDDDFKALADGLMQSGKSVIEWPEGALLSDMSEDHCKLLLNIIGLAANALPRGGMIAMHTSRAVAGTIMSVMARGDGANLSDDLVAALTMDISVDSLSPRNIHAYFCQCVAHRNGQAVKVSQASAGNIEFSWAL